MARSFLEREKSRRKGSKKDAEAYTKAAGKFCDDLLDQRAENGKKIGDLTGAGVAELETNNATRSSAKLSPATSSGPA